MAQIDVDSDAYAHAQSALREAADALRAAGGRLAGAVPPLAFGPLVTALPAAIASLGVAIDGASATVGAVAEGTSDGIARALAIFDRVDENARTDLMALEAEL